MRTVGPSQAPSGEFPVRWRMAGRCDATQNDFGFKVANGEMPCDTPMEYSPGERR